MRKLERERAQTNEQYIRYTPDSPPSVIVTPHRLCFDGNCGGDDHNEEVLRWVLDLGGCGAGLLAIVMAGVEVIAVDIAMEGIQSAANKTADEENK